MSDWPEQVEACANCTGEPSLYAYGARNYCNRCYQLIRRIERVQAWDRGRPETLKGIAKSGMVNPDFGKSTELITDTLTDEQFGIYRTEIIRQLKSRLALLRHREEIRRREVSVDAYSLERKFAQLLHLVRPKARYPHNASYLNEHFNEAERRVIYGLLEEIIEQAPWRGIQWWPVFRRIAEHNST